MLRLLDILALLAYCAVIFWLSHQPYLPVPDLFEFQDKFHHFTAYFVMGLLAWRGIRHVVTSPYNLTLASIVFCSFYGITDEWHQSFVPGRDASFLDWGADTIGAAVALLVLTKFQALQKQFR